MDEGSNFHMFTYITIWTYTKPVKYNLQIRNGRKSPANVFGFVIVNIIKTNIITPFWPSYYMHKNPENKISQTAHKHYNQFIRIINKALIWLQIATNTGKKTKV